MTNECEVCGSKSLSLVLDLGQHPLCDDLVPINDLKKCKEYPIRILLCDECKTALQDVEVDKVELFSPAYHYRSRFTADVVSGMRSLVSGIERLDGKLTGKKVVDIGCNDGSLLSIFSEKGCLTIGVEPTGAIKDADSNKHKLYNSFFDHNLAETISTQYGFPDIVTFTNVFAHIENLPQLLSALNKLIGDQTLIVIENHYLGSVLQKNQFDTFYHEHPRTYSLSSFTKIAKKLNCRIIDLEFPKRYGGNIRVTLSKRKKLAATKESLELIKSAVEQEKQYRHKFEQMDAFISNWKICKNKEINSLVEKYGLIPAKAFPGRAAILIKLLGLDENHLSAVYEKPGSMKIGNYVPGTRIPIKSDEELFSQKPKFVLNLAWHIKKEIKSYLLENGVDAKIIDIL